MFDAGVASRLLAQTSGRLFGPVAPSRPDDLTTREREVLDLLAEGASMLLTFHHSWTPDLFQAWLASSLQRLLLPDT